MDLLRTLHEDRATTDFGLFCEILDFLFPDFRAFDHGHDFARTNTVADTLVDLVNNSRHSRDNVSETILVVCHLTRKGQLDIEFSSARGCELDACGWRNSLTRLGGMIVACMCIALGLSGVIVACMCIALGLSGVIVASVLVSTLLAVVAAVAVALFAVLVLVRLGMIVASVLGVFIVPGTFRLGGVIVASVLNETGGLSLLRRCV